LVFIHAGVADRRSWYEVMEIVGRHRRCVAFDQRGFGDTTYDTSPFSGLDDLLAVFDQKGIADAVVVGCSKGGQLAFEASLCAQERVAALVLIGSAPQGEGAPSADIPAAVGELFAAVEEADDAGDMDRVNELEAQAWLDGPLAPAGRVSGPARELFLDMNGRALEAPATGDEQPITTEWEDLDQVTAPTLLIVGSLELPLLRDRMEAMAGIIPGAELVVIDGVAHLPMLEQPARVADELLRFLSD